MKKDPSQLSIADLQKAGNEAAKQAIAKLHARGIEPAGEDVPMVGRSLDSYQSAHAARAARKAS